MPSAPANHTAPPLLIFLPGLPDKPANSARRVADILADKASEGPGTFSVEKLASSYEGLGDGGRIVRHDGGGALDVLELDYRPGLLRAQATGSGLGALLHRLLLSLRYVLWSGQLLVHGGRRAKSGVAKAQILIGLLSMATLLFAFVVTLVAVLVALGFVDEPLGTERLADAVAIGVTAVTTWLFVRVRPAIVRMALLVEQLMDFVHDDRREGSVARRLAVAIDRVLEAAPGRHVYILGYSLGSLVTIAFAFPRNALHISRDERHADALKGLFTIGCPADFARLYVPQYLNDRTPRVADLAWTNIYIAADVLASNFLDRDDETGGPGAEKAPVPMSIPRPISLRYTSETLTWLNIWSRKGFLSHGGYWDDVGNESCLRLVVDRLPALAPAVTPDPSTAA